jgi:hypothetical protein
MAVIPAISALVKQWRLLRGLEGVSAYLLSTMATL